ncbi:carboxypeptidase regulatory-like domain-containing protein [bacterium]|nr:carboxypeptidase regulatory-like domain-containing protein [bacterium]
MRKSLLAPLLIGLLVSAGCTTGQLVDTTGGNDSGLAARNTATGEYTGQVLGLNGKPAVNVQVQGYLVSNNSASIISNNSGGLISHNGSKYAILAAETLSTTTDAKGRFKLVSRSGLPMNVEAVLSANVKAIQLGVTEETSAKLQLAKTGQISGRVTTPKAPSVTNWEGVDVFIPGTSYVAKTDAAGRYTLSNVPVGTFDLVGTKAGLGRGNQPSVGVASEQTTQAPDLALSVTTPEIASISQPNGGPGSVVTLTGSNFGASTGESLEVTFGGAQVAAPQRVDDRTLRVEVPPAADSGAVVVTVSGIKSNAKNFTVLSELILSPRFPYLRKGRPQRYTVTALDRDKHVVSNPSVTWSVTGNTFQLNNGLVTPTGEGQGTLRVTSGMLRAPLDLQAFDGPVVNTLAGSYMGFRDGVGSEAQFSYPNGVAVDASGSVYVADRNNHRIRMISGDGLVSTLAGTGLPGRKNTIGAAAEFYSPACVAPDGKGNLFLTEAGNHDVRCISLTTGMVSTVAGDGVAGYYDAWTPLETARFNTPHGLAVGSDGTLYVADWGNQTIRFILPNRAVRTMANIIVYNGTPVPGFVDGSYANARFNYPIGVAVDSSGKLYVSDQHNNRIRRIDTDLQVSTFAGNGDPALFNGPHDLAVDAAGNVLVADHDHNQIKQIAPDGTIRVIAGSGEYGLADGRGSQASFNEPFGVAVDASGSIYVGDRNNHRIRLIWP